ncbi:tetratricopeptide repeat protein [Catenovulum sp. SM1970]|uniref:tetratricopeptide repeat protein n=1 Tax=Marinifaba aquimaris TaxID=2741323 RepID=UPI001573EB9D|nr:tetratricopeptide repeat protein [Marinifaba aquimaris]NTS78315.1 tetratricopeptide repeat protein [Marinifaba aquimaris]
MNKPLLSLLLGLAVALGSAGHATAEQEPTAQTKKTKRVPALRSKVYSQLAHAQGLADKGNVTEALEALDNVKRKKNSMNSYEIAMMHNFYAFILYQEEDYKGAADNFKEVIAQDVIPESLHMATLYSLAQLSMMQNDYVQTVAYIDQWMALNSKPNERAYVLKAQAYYQSKDYKNTLEAISTAINLADEKGQVPNENWLVLQRAAFYELKQPEKVVQVLERMVALYDKPEYWIQLSNMYGEVGREEEQLAIMETAFQRGFVTKHTDIKSLSQLYVFNQVPYKGAKLLEQGIKDGKIDENVDNLKFVAQSLTMAREDEKAIPVLTKAAELAENGDLYAQLGQTLLNLDRNKEAIAAIKKAQAKGDLTDLGTAKLVLGMAHFNLKEYVDSELAFEQAIDHKSSRRLANQWVKYVKSEKQNALQLANIAAQ